MRGVKDVVAERAIGLDGAASVLAWDELVMSYGEDCQGDRGQGASRAIAFHLTHLWGRPMLDVDIVSHCNLGCRCCCHFSPVTEARFLTLDEYARELGLLAQVKGAADYFESINLMGGEPLLHPELAGFVRLTHELLPATRTRVCSNGLLVREVADDVWDAMRAAGVCLYLTPYPIGIDYQGLVTYAGDRGVRAEVSNGLAVGEGGTPYFLSTPLDEHGGHDVTQAFMECPLGGVSLQLVGGRLFPCNRGALFETLNERFGTSFAHESEDYLELAFVSDVDEIADFRRTPKPMCRYCAYERTVRVEWGRSTGEPSEWIVVSSSVSSATR